MISPVHSAVKATIEQARTDKALGSSLQCSVILSVEDKQVTDDLAWFLEDLEAIFVVSSVHINTPLPEDPAWSYTQEIDVQGSKVRVHVLPPREEKCPRCWRYVAPAEDELCGRCDEVVGRIKEEE